MQVVVDNHTIDVSLAAHGWDAIKTAHHGQGALVEQRYASRTRRRLLTDMHAPSDPRVVVLMPQENGVRIEHEQGPLLPIAGLHARVLEAHSPCHRCTLREPAV